MSDEFDLASEHEDKERERIIAATRARVIPVQPVFFCLWCGDNTEGNRWCDADCRDSWEREIAGKPHLR